MYGLKAFQQELDMGIDGFQTEGKTKGWKILTNVVFGGIPSNYYSGVSYFERVQLSCQVCFQPQFSL